MVFEKDSAVSFRRLFRSIAAALFTTESILPNALIAQSTIFFGESRSFKSSIHR